MPKQAFLLLLLKLIDRWFFPELFRTQTIQNDLQLLAHEVVFPFNTQMCQKFVKAFKQLSGN